MTAKTFVKSRYPSAKNMYQENAGHAIMYYNSDLGKDIILSYGSTSAKVWKNAKKNIEENKTNQP